MRITGGFARGRRIAGPKGLALRPTSDRVREALFQILTVRMGRSWEKCRVLDLFAGSGALGIEALSRGAQEAVFVDRHPAALDLVRRNLAASGLASRARVIRAEIGRSRGLQGVPPVELVLADPPYGMGLGLRALAWVSEAGLLCKGGWMVVEEFRDAGLPVLVHVDRGVVGADSKGVVQPLLELQDRRVYGQTQVCFYLDANRSQECSTPREE